MKKLALVVLAAACAASMAACGGSKPAETTAAPATEAAAAKEETTEAAAEEVDYSKFKQTDLEYHSVAAIQQRGELHWATEATYAPYAFMDADGNIVGLEADMCKAIAEAMGVELVIDNMAFDSVLPSVQSGLDDVGIAALTPTAERKEVFTFTQSYLSNGQMSLVRAADVDKFKDESAMTADVVVGAQKGSYQEQVAQELYPDCTLRAMEAVPSVIMDLKAGNIDIAIMDYDNAYNYAYQNEDLETAFVVPMLGDDEPSNCGAVMLGNDDLADYLNVLIQGWIDDGTMQKWYEDAVALEIELGIE